MDTNHLLTVLLVEDEPDLRAYFVVMLPRTDPSIDLRTAGSLAEARERLALGGIQVILFDPGLPDSSGVLAIRALRREYPNIPIVVLSASEQLEIDAIRAGAQDFVLKHKMDLQNLIACIRHAVIRHEVQEMWRPVREPVAELKEIVRHMEELNDQSPAPPPE